MSLESLAGGMNEMKSTQDDSGNAMKFDPDKRIDVYDNRTLFADNNASQFNPDKRMDANDNRISDLNNETKFDPDKRVDMQSCNDDRDCLENKNSEESGDKVSETEGLTDEQRMEIKEKTGWSDEVLDYIHSEEEADVYMKAGLTEIEIGEKKCLVREDIVWEQKDEKGRTNSERIQRGLSPLDKEGNAIELHHIGQHTDSPLAELTQDEHRCNGNDSILHDKSKESEVHGEGNNWSNERQDYWKNRSVYNEGGDI